ncbi:hypothetical protein EV421DRAFT_1789965 [Armillaria borealis]|uniref:Uncharacterized protein n=1 Tax=Armillaria borealis TaxID=47425 RepID=A0AA39MV85_9AGAR|nr:hypothetical protein EV421DRAFT_1789965 [Armillaria borealis]
MRYTFTDKHGKLYRSAPGEQYGTLTPVDFSASTDRPGAFSDGNDSKVRETSRKLTFSDFLPPTAMASASSSLHQNLPVPPPRAHFNGAVRTALPKMQGAHTKGSAKHAYPLPPPEDGKNGTGSVDTSVKKSKSSKPKA